MNGKPYFIFNTAPGGLIQGAVRVVNVSATAGQVELYAANATTRQTSGAIYLQHRARHGVGTWLQLSAHRLALGPHQGSVVSFSGHVPSSVASGQHLAGLVAAPLQARVLGGKRALRVNVQESATVAVQVNLPGQIQRISINRVGASNPRGSETLLLGLANTGNTLVQGNGTLTVSTAGGQRALNQSFALGTFVPQTTIEFPVYVRGQRLPAGRYYASVTITYGDQHKLQDTFPFRISSQQPRRTDGTALNNLGGPGSVPPKPAWGLAIGAIVLVGVGVGAVSLFFRRRAVRS